MSLTLATILSAAMLLLLGASLLVFPAIAESALMKFPRSPVAAYVCFGSALIWFLIKVWRLSPADFGEEHVALFFGCGMIGLLAFKFAPDFLALRGLCALVLMTAGLLLRAGFMKYDVPGVYFQTSLVYLGITLALILAGQPWRWRDGFEWLFEERSRIRILAGLFLAYGVLLGLVALGAAQRHV